MRNFGILDDEKFLIGFFLSFLQFNEIVCWCGPKCRNISRTKSSLASNTKPMCLNLLIRTNEMNNNSFYLIFLRLLQPIYHKIKTQKKIRGSREPEHATCKRSAASGRTDFSSQTSFTTRLETVMMTFPTRVKLFLPAQWNILQHNMMKLSAVFVMHETKKITETRWLRFCPKPSNYAAFSWPRPRFKSNFLSHNGH